MSTPSSPVPEPVGSALSPANPNKKKKQNSQTGKKVTHEILERRRIGRLKAAETMARKIKSSGIERRDNPLKYSVFEQLNLINQKNYFTDYLKKDEQAFILRERRQLRLSKQKSNQSKSTPQINDDEDEELDEDEEDIDDNEEDLDENDKDGVEKKVRKRYGSDVLVLHPGSRYLRIGLASDIYPKTVPFVIATPGELKEESLKSYELNDEELENYDKNKESLQRDFKERMKYYKRRILPNSNEICANFNKKIIPEKISEINDIHRLDYIKPNNDAKNYYIGDDALRLDSQDFRLRWPLITNGKFNYDEYNSIQEMIGEIQLFLTKTLESQLNVKSLKNFKIVLIIPDLYDKNYVETFTKLLLQLNFQGVSIIQESLAATYGAGVTQACVIDIGAKTTKVSCIDDGMIIPNSRAVLNYGGDDITRYFYKLLKESSFPIDFNEDVGHEWIMMEQLKEKFITFQDANVTVQLYNFIKRYPNKLSEKYEFKVFDEVMLAPLGLFFPEVFKKRSTDETDLINLDKKSIDIFTGELNDPISITQKNSFDKNLYANKGSFNILKDLLNSENFDNGLNTNSKTFSELDKIIIQSIANGSRHDFTKSKIFYENLLIVGGSAKIESLDFILTDRINIWRPKILSYLQFFDFFKKLETTVTSFEKKNELSKLQPDDENLKKFQIQLDEIIERELDEFMNNSNNSILSVEVLPSPRDIEPSILTWKGGSVFARLKIMEELWITERDWNLLGSRTLQHKLLFNY